MSAKPSLRAVSLDELNRLSQNTMMEAMGVEFTAVGSDFVEARMPVDRRTHQVHGLLHGGASAALAETLGSVGAHLAVDPAQHRCVGVEINANHLAGAESGWVVGRAEPLRIGRSIQVWNIEVRHEDGRLLCVSRLTVAVVPARRS